MSRLRQHDHSEQRVQWYLRGQCRPNEVAPYPTVAANFYAHDNIVYMTGSAYVRPGEGHRRWHHQQSVRPQHVSGNRILSRAWWTWPTVYDGHMGDMARRRTGYGRHSRYLVAADTSIAVRA